MSQPPRVLQLVDSLARAGAEQSLALLAPHLLKHGIDLHVAYLVERGGLRTTIEQNGIPVHSLAGRDLSRRDWLRRAVDLIGEIRPAVVHTTLFEADLAGRRAAARCDVPCVSSFVNTVYGRTESTRDGVNLVRLRAAQAADAVTARRVARFHAVTRHVAEVMGRRLLVPASKIEVIPRGRDPEILGRRTPQRRAATRERLGLSADVPLILAVGRQEPQKGFDVLLRALPTIQARFPDVRAVVAGRDGRATASLTQLTRTLGLSDMVTFVGMRDDVPDLLSAADVLAFPSLWEGAAGTLQEAMALECPIVTSRLPSILETVDETTAELVSAGDAAALASGVLATFVERNRTEQRARAARRRFEASFTIEVSASHMAKLYSRVATG
jgi:glycosyltransferase involved in cell wall biosynthesis